MTAFTLDARLARDCLVLGHLPTSQVLLMNNTDYPWLIVVPETTHTEWCDLPPSQALALHQETMEMSRFVRQHFSVSKLNVAAIGNVVSQLHVHVVGRNEHDPAWPGVVWGASTGDQYSSVQVDEIRRQFMDFLNL